jgi:hypothetical protein
VDGIKHLRYNLPEQALLDFMNLSTTIPSLEIITNGIPGVFDGTNEFVREVKIAEVLQQKFPNMPKYHTAEGLKDWLSDRMSDGHQAAANALSRIQGDAGEVDFVRDMQGSIHNIFHKFDFVRNADGRITSNYPGIDAVEVNRFTGGIVNEFQVKTLRSVHSIDSTLKDFINNDHYNTKITLVGPKELIDRAHEMGLPNPTKVMGTIQNNLDSAHKLSEKILSEQLPVSFSSDAVLHKMADGAAIGAVVSVTVAALIHFMQYRSGKITFDELKVKIAQGGVKGAVTGGALAGLSLFIPGGLIGYGIAFVTGTTLRRLLDEGFGNGAFGEILKATKAVHANVQLLHHGTVYIAKVAEFNDKLLARSITTIDDMAADRNRADEIYTKLERKQDNGHCIDYSWSAEDFLAACDTLQNKLRGVSKQ